jgi:hypothetical protein
MGKASASSRPRRAFIHRVYGRTPRLFICDLAYWAHSKAKDTVPSGGCWENVVKIATKAEFFQYLA